GSPVAIVSTPASTVCSESGEHVVVSPLADPPSSDDEHAERTRAARMNGVNLRSFFIIAFLSCPLTLDLTISCRPALVEILDLVLTRSTPPRWRVAVQLAGA
ncbi:MAG: hypothetical protein RL673_658, partial [Actinomycetota bacterium]